MKAEIIALSPIGAVALVFAGVLFGKIIHGDGDLITGLVLVMLLICVRSDARESWQNGTWTLGRVFWKRTGPLK